MCGFVGGTMAGGDYGSGIDRIRHRGPDDRRIYRDEKVTLAFARLAIVDLDPRAGQPMTSPDGQVVLVFNGEIYAYRDLRDRLRGLGHVFETESDTEVLLHAYLQWGDEFVEQVDGMFAIACYDRRHDRITLWRDRVGIKPLYYYWDGRELIFASEIKAILATYPGADVPRFDAYYDFLTYHNVPPPKTGFRNIHQVRPAQRLAYDIGPRRLHASRSYWELSAEPDTDMTDETASQAIREAVGASVGEQLVADVPLGSFLSGGVDSSVISYEAASRVEKLTTFSVGFSTEKNELPFANLVATRLNSSYVEQIVGIDDFDLSMMRSWFDEPFGDTSAIPTHAVACAAAEHVKVALSGDGGDELFGGYDRYRAMRTYGARSLALFNQLERFKGRFDHRTIPRRAMNLVGVCLAPQIAKHGKSLNGLSHGEKRPYAELFQIPDDYDDYWAWREYWRTDLPLRTRLQFVDFHRYLPDDLLAKVDRTSMATSLEVRVPFLARRVVELAFRIPERLRYRGGLKGLLRSAYRERLPDSILDRPKQGFGVPRSYLPCAFAYQPAIILSQLFDVPLPKGFRVAPPVRCRLAG